MATVIKWEGVEVATVQSANQASPYRLKVPSCEIFFSEIFFYIGCVDL